ncbi:unnamed protein product, partial [Brenthis ino]
MLLLLLIFAAGSLAVPLQDKCGYESCTQAEPGVLNVHIVPHTHDDVGWLKTVDQYYYGSRNNIQKAGVQYILDSVIKELWQDPKRRFIYVETAFFWKWWMHQSDDVRHKVDVLVRQGRLQFVGGAWSMNDEAASHYQSTIDQFTWGLRKLFETFDTCGIPRVGWQIDPFGHSREFASLLANMGYDGLFLGRIDYQDKMARLQGKNMEMLWRGDDDLGKPSDIFTGVLYNTYSPPPGFCFDILCDDEPIIDDPYSPMFNVDSRVNYFITYVLNQAKHYRSNNTIVTMGGDFTYQDAAMWYKNLDKLIEYANMKSAKDGLNIKLFYSTPNCYLKAVKDSNPTLPTKQDDFFPYASDPTAYWTGYFTSRPTTKYFERQGNAYLQMAKNLQVLGDLPEHNKFVLNELKSAMGVMQHHDAVTGTEKQHVADDYVRMLDAAVENSLLIARQAFSKLSQGDALKPAIFSYDRCSFNESSCPTSENSRQFVVTIYNPVGWNVLEPIRIPVKKGIYEVYAPNGDKISSQLVTIPEPVLNIPTRNSEATHEIVFIAKLHPLGIKSFYIKKISPKTKRNAEIKRKNDYYGNINDYWKNIHQQTDIEIRNIENEEENREFEEKIPFPMIIGNMEKIIIDKTDINMLKDKQDLPVGVEELERLVGEGNNLLKGNRYLGKNENYPILNEEEMRMLSDEPQLVERPDEYYVENEYLKLRVDNSTGHVTHMLLPDRTTNMRIQMNYWTGFIGDNMEPAHRSSGAYIFRPKTTIPYPLNYKTNTNIHGDIVQEIRADTHEHASSCLRIYKGLNYFEHDFVIGPIDIQDGEGKEYTVRYETNVANRGIFFTDSNGRQMLKRTLNQRPQYNVTLREPIAGNYYPVTNEIYIQDDNTRIVILTDRSQGGSSLEEGSIELMLHRRLLHDDAFGVGEALNETAKNAGLVVRGRHRLLNISPGTNEVLIERKMAIQMHLSPIVFVSNADDVTYETWIKLNNCFKGLKVLPDGVHLLTLEPWSSDKTLLLRIENYLDKSMENSTVDVDLGDIFNNLKILSVRETNLAANQWLENMTKWEWKTENDFSNNSNNYDNVNNNEKVFGKMGNDLKIQVKAKQIRTFLAKYENME